MLRTVSLPFSCTIKIQLPSVWPAHADISNPNVCLGIAYSVGASGFDLLWSPRARADCFAGLMASVLAQGVVPHMCLLSTAMIKCTGLLKAYRVVNLYKVRLGSGIASFMQTALQSTLLY